MVVGDQGSGSGLAGSAVVPDGGGKRVDALGDVGGDVVTGAFVVVFEVELACQRVVD